VGPQISATDIIELKRRGVSKIIVARPDGETDDQPAISESGQPLLLFFLLIHRMMKIPVHGLAKFSGNLILQQPYVNLFSQKPVPSLLEKIVRKQFMLLMTVFIGETLLQNSFAVSSRWAD
ncbi:MAG: hypothetical protein HN764_03855, partial [Gammaproteobacteria bacterium]|nr:hypothetical protein [Gammaproteobacteria bacterium]